MSSKLTTIDSFKSQMLPNYFERQNSLLKSDTSDIGSSIAFAILTGIENELLELKDKKIKTAHNKVLPKAGVKAKTQR